MHRCAYQQKINRMSVVWSAKWCFSNIVFILAPVSPCVFLHIPKCRYMCWQVWVRVSVCQSSSVNIVLCSSNSSSSYSAVAARSTVYFHSWRTTSYQISRHCFQARCPTTCSQRISRPLSCRLSYSEASASPWWLTAIWTTHINIHTEMLIVTAVISAKMSPSPPVYQRGCGQWCITRKADILHSYYLGAAAMLYLPRIYSMSSEIITHSYTELMWQMTQCFFPVAMAALAVMTER